MRSSRRVVLLGVAVAACSIRTPHTVAAKRSEVVTSQSLPTDCLGPDSVVTIEPGRIGALRLDLTLRDLHRRCPNLRDTIARGDESLDTAVLISRTNLAVVGRVANIMNDEGGHPYTLDSSRVIAQWTVTGTAGLLPGGVPLSAPWDSLVHAFGTPKVEPLNGDVYVWFCDRVPALVFHFDDPLYFTSPAAPETFPASLAGQRIRSLDLPGQPLPQTRSPACE